MGSAMDSLFHRRVVSHGQIKFQGVVYAAPELAGQDGRRVEFHERAGVLLVPLDGQLIQARPVASAVIGGAVR